MKIYFAGSIRAGRDDVELYQKIIEQIRKYGEVLTEHVGDYSLSVAGQKQLSDTYIHDRDLAWLLSADLVVAEVTNPSLGVGYEIGTAMQRQIPVIALYRDHEGRQLSAMIAGCAGVQVIHYEETDMDHAYAELDRLIQDFARKGAQR